MGRVMDLAHFGLTRRPFRPTADTDAYFASPSHDAAVEGLTSAFAARDGLALVDGSTGSGKTLAALKFLEGLENDVPRLLIPAPRFARAAEFFQAVLFDLGVEYRGLSDHELRLAVMDQLLNKLAAGHPTVLVLDEAQHLNSELLEEVRLLGNLETRSAKALFIVLVALPSLRERWTKPEFAGLAQRVSVRLRIEPLDREESAKYIWHQLQVAGGRPADLISEEAINLLTAQCQGLPRLLNQACSLAFNLARSAGESTVDTEAAMEALTRLGFQIEEPVQETLVLPKPVEVKKAPRRRAA